MSPPRNDEGTVASGVAAPTSGRLLDLALGIHAAYSAFFLYSVVGALTPLLKTHWAFTTQQMGTALSLYSGSSLIALIASMRYLDRWTASRTLIGTNVAIFSGSMVVASAALVPSHWRYAVLCTGIALLATGSSMSYAAANKLMTRWWSNASHTTLTFALAHVWLRSGSFVAVNGVPMAFARWGVPGALALLPAAASTSILCSLVFGVRQSRAAKAKAAAALVAVPVAPFNAFTPGMRNLGSDPVHGGGDAAADDDDGIMHGWEHVSATVCSSDDSDDELDEARSLVNVDSDADDVEAAFAAEALEDGDTVTTTLLPRSRPTEHPSGADFVSVSLVPSHSDGEDETAPGADTDADAVSNDDDDEVDNDNDAGMRETPSDASTAPPTPPTLLGQLRLMPITYWLMLGCVSVVVTDIYLLDEFGVDMVFERGAPNLSQSAASHTASLISLSNLLSIPLAGALIARFGHRLHVGLAALFALSVLHVTLLCPSLGVPAWVSCVGVGLMQSALENSLLPTLALTMPVQVTGVGYALANVGWNVGLLVLPTVFGVLHDGTGSYTLTLIPLTLLVVLAVGCTMALGVINGRRDLGLNKVEPLTHEQALAKQAHEEEQYVALDVMGSDDIDLVSMV